MMNYTLTPGCWSWTVARIHARIIYSPRELLMHLRSAPDPTPPPAPRRERQINIRLDGKDVEVLDAEAASLGLTRSTLLRMALVDFMARRGTPMQLRID